MEAKFTLYSSRLIEILFVDIARLVNATRDKKRLIGRVNTASKFGLTVRT